VTRRRCGWPERECRAPAGWHATRPGERRPWGYHDEPCPHRTADPALYPECALAADHAGPCQHRARLARASNRGRRAA
jgi:hypothetical protein